LGGLLLRRGKGKGGEGEGHEPPPHYLEEVYAYGAPHTSKSWLRHCPTETVCNPPFR